MENLQNAVEREQQHEVPAQPAAKTQSQPGPLVPVPSQPGMLVPTTTMPATEWPALPAFDANGSAALDIQAGVDAANQRGLLVRSEAANRAEWHLTAHWTQQHIKSTEAIVDDSIRAQRKTISETEAMGSSYVVCVQQMLQGTAQRYLHSLKQADLSRLTADTNDLTTNMQTIIDGQTAQIASSIDERRRQGKESQNQMLDAYASQTVKMDEIRNNQNNSMIAHVNNLKISMAEAATAASNAALAIRQNEVAADEARDVQKHKRKMQELENDDKQEHDAINRALKRQTADNLEKTFQEYMRQYEKNLGVARANADKDKWKNFKITCEPPRKEFDASGRLVNVHPGYVNSDFKG